MSPQFVDFDGDGHPDILTATYDGSPQVSYGSEEGFGVPEHLKDAQGERIIITSYWNYEDQAHQTTSRAMLQAAKARERCVSAFAFDWDGDGDYDLLLGSYENGHLYRQMNEGTNAKPMFTGENIPVMAGGTRFELSAKMTALRLVDWDGDGDLDLLAGTFGDRYNPSAPGGGVYLSLNHGEKGRPSFGSLDTLVAPSSGGHTAPLRPDLGLYADAADYDGDGDLDLIVGGYSIWTPMPRALSEGEQANLVRLRQAKSQLVKNKREVGKKMSDEIRTATAGMNFESDVYSKTYLAIMDKYQAVFGAFARKINSLTKQIERLTPGPQRRAFVWLYERI